MFPWNQRVYILRDKKGSWHVQQVNERKKDRKEERKKERKKIIWQRNPFIFLFSHTICCSISTATVRARRSITSRLRFWIVMICFYLGFASFSIYQLFSFFRSFLFTFFICPVRCTNNNCLHNNTNSSKYISYFCY